MTENGFNFQTMTSKDDINIEGYKEALNTAFEDPQVHNIAVTGPYGSGKSSVIQSYEKSKPPKKFIYISLAKFENNKENTDPKKDLSHQLEGKILNQLVYQMNYGKIPQTDFKLKRKPSERSIFKWTLYIFLFISIVLYFVMYSQMNEVFISFEGTILRKILFITTSFPMFLIAGIIIAWISIYFLNTLVKKILQGNFLKKFKWSDKEIELFDKKQDSYFDKYLDEIVYLFQQSEWKTIVFEDIDRFDQNNVFGRLREINHVINKKQEADNEVENPKLDTIRFIYMLRDDLFISQDRTKFFDFILPIVPVLDNSNSFNQLLNILRKGEHYDDFSQHFLERVSLYIGDFRLLKNVYNEYQIYYHRIENIGIDEKSKKERKNQAASEKSLGLNRDKLFAILLYKNIFPQDFRSLQYRQGYVFQLFEHEYRLRSDRYEKNKSKIYEKQADRKVVENELLQSINELDAITIKLPTDIRVDDKKEKEFANRVDFIKAIKEKDYQVEPSKDVRKIFKELKEDTAYNERREIVEKKAKQVDKELKKEIDILIRENKKLSGKKLHNLLNAQNEKEYFNHFGSIDSEEIGRVNKNYQSIQSSEYFGLIKLLIREGYIDKNYHDYVSYFIPNSLTRGDKKFLKNVSERTKMDPAYGLDYPGMVANKMVEAEFMHDEVLNYALIDYLVNNLHDENIKHRFASLLEKLKDEKLFEFIFTLLNTITDKEVFIQETSQYWDTMFLDLTSTSEILDSDKNNFIVESMFILSVKELENMNKENCLANFIEKQDDFLGVENPEINNIIDHLKGLQVKFEAIKKDAVHSDLFQSVYENDMYQINIKMVQTLMETYYGVNDVKTIQVKGYSILKTKEDEPLYQYVTANLSTFLSEIYFSEEYIMDDELVVIEIVNHPDVDSELKKEYIKHLVTVINDIQYVEDQAYWAQLIQEKNVAYDMKNIVAYGKLDEVIADFINDSTQDIILKKEYLDEEKLKEIVIKLIKKDKINDEKTVSILKKSNVQLDSVPSKNIETSRMEMAIREKLFVMNYENLLFIKEHYFESFHFFILQNMSDYLALLSILEENGKLEEEVLIGLLKDSKVKEDDKIYLLDYIQSKISVFATKFSDKVILKILNDKYDENDFERLVLEEHYDNFSSKVKNEIEDICIKSKEYLYDETLPLAKTLLTSLIYNDELKKEEKKKILSFHLGGIDLETMKTYLETLEEEDLKSLFNRGRPRIPNTEENTRILQYFKKKEWIISKPELVDNKRVYKVYGRDL